MLLRNFLAISLLALTGFNASGHGKAHYLGNSAVVVQNSGIKIMFDPFFHNDFGIYQQVPAPLREKVMAGEAPYDGIDAIFISHAHEDHFNVHDVLSYLQRHPDTLLFGPLQAVSAIEALSLSQEIQNRLHSVNLDFGEAPVRFNKGQLDVEVVRIPHAGWPARKEVHNLVFRVSLAQQHTAMHMGDADPDDDHYLPYRAYWEAKKTDINFPPYWFFSSAEGRDILHEILNANKHIGVHVPVNAPRFLTNGNYQYFHQPEETRTID